MNWVWVAFGGALGAMARYGVVALAARLSGTGFPYGTLTVNVAGSLAMGVAAALMMARGGALPGGPFLMSGLLGGFTTFSAFSLDAVTLFEQGRLAAAGFYILGSVLLSVAALIAGLALTRSALA